MAIIMALLINTAMICDDRSSVNPPQIPVSNLFRNVPFLTSLEMSLFLLICLLSLGCPPERSPAPRFVRRV